MTLTQPKQPALYPGMNCDGMEFFAVESEMKFIADSEIQCISKLPYSVIQTGNEFIENNEELKDALYELHPSSQFARLNQFLSCRYGGLDHSADFANNEFKEGDYHHCPKRVTCKFNGIICTPPKYNDNALSSLDIQLMILLSGNHTNETIADDLEIPLGSLHKHKQYLYEKLGGVQTKQEVALIAKSLNLI